MYWLSVSRAPESAQSAPEKDMSTHTTSDISQGVGWIPAACVNQLFLWQLQYCYVSLSVRVIELYHDGEAPSPPVIASVAFMQAPKKIVF